ncbi:MAG: acetyl-CoA carboxylase biotin carboxyl carrier protein [Rhodothermales bacterium]
MDLKKLREMLKIVAESDVAEVEIDEDGTKVTIRRNAPTISVQPSGYYPPIGMYPQPITDASAPIQQPAMSSNSVAAPTSPAQAPEKTGAPAASSEKETTIRAPIVGTFYASPSPDAESFVTVGSRVSQGSVLCIIEAMKLMNEIESEAAGTVVQILVENAEPVEYDQPLFVIEADA